MSIERTAKSKSQERDAMGKTGQEKEMARERYAKRKLRQEKEVRTEEGMSRERGVKRARYQEKENSVERKGCREKEMPSERDVRKDTFSTHQHDDEESVGACFFCFVGSYFLTETSAPACQGNLCSASAECLMQIS